jgi:hypothetical protein
MKQLILNRNADEVWRSVAITALGVLVAWNEIPQQVASDYFLWLAQEGLEREPSSAWDELANICVDIEAVQVFPELRRAYADGLADPSIMKPEELDDAAAGPRGEWLERFRESYPPITDVVEATSWWQCMADNPWTAMTNDAAVEKAQSQWEPQPFRSNPKVGRNDPCPCGSGKKFKKCCGE